MPTMPTFSQVPLILPTVARASSTLPIENLLECSKCMQAKRITLSIVPSSQPATTHSLPSKAISQDYPPNQIGTHRPEYSYVKPLSIYKIKLLLLAAHAGRRRCPSCNSKDCITIPYVIEGKGARLSSTRIKHSETAQHSTMKKKKKGPAFAT